MYFLVLLISIIGKKISNGVRTLKAKTISLSNPFLLSPPNTSFPLPSICRAKVVGEKFYNLFVIKVDQSLKSPLPCHEVGCKYGTAKAKITKKQQIIFREELKVSSAEISDSTSKNINSK